MPLYEEKLVSPLALRFTQDHIRTTFRDGRYVENSIEEIRIGHGVDGYDAILRAPFPAIEILRWCMPRQDADRMAETVCPVGVRPREHWFTLDNRRLYCLQRAAVAMWPKRVGAVVNIMYADPGTVRKKFDSISYGYSVNIGHSYDDIPILRWDWREKILPLEVNAFNEGHGVLQTVIDDDRKRTLDALLDAAAYRKNQPQDDTVGYDERGRVMVGGSASSTAAPKAVGRVNATPPSTVDGSEAGSDVGDAIRGYGKHERRKATGDEPRPNLADAYDPVVANAIREIKERINSRDAGGQMIIPHWDDRYGEILGPLWDFVSSRPDKFQVVPLDDGGFTVVKARKRGSVEASQDDAARLQGLADLALAEIEEMLSDPKHDGRVSLPQWRENYEGALGSLKRFLRNYPDRFTVIAGEGRHFRVVKSSEGMAMRAIREIEEQFQHRDFEGKVEIKRWAETYEEELGDFESFLLRYPEKFTVSRGRGGLRVERTRDHLIQKALQEIDDQFADPNFDGTLDLPNWETTYGPELGSLEGFLESRSDRFILNFCNDGSGRRYTVEKNSDDIAARALREVETQVCDPKHDGRLRVSRWNERYRDYLGPLRNYLERFPDKFTVTSTEDGKFLVTRRTDQVAIEAMRIIESAIDEPNFNGTVEIPTWETRFQPDLESFREFLVSKPEHFKVIPDGDGFQIEWADPSLEMQAILEIEATIAVKGNPGHIKLSNWAARYSTDLGDFRGFVEGQPGRFKVIPEPNNKFSVALVPEEMVRTGVAEVEKRMKEEGYDGLLQIPDWNQLFLPFLGTLRKFVQSRPENFKVINFGNVMYTFPASDWRKEVSIDDSTKAVNARNNSTKAAATTTHGVSVSHAERACIQAVADVGNRGGQSAAGIADKNSKNQPGMRNTGGSDFPKGKNGKGFGKGQKDASWTSGHKGGGKRGRGQEDWGQWQGNYQQRWRWAPATSFSSSDWM